MPSNGFPRMLHSVTQGKAGGSVLNASETVNNKTTPPAVMCRAHGTCTVPRPSTLGTFPSPTHHPPARRTRRPAIPCASTSPRPLPPAAPHPRLSQRQAPDADDGESVLHLEAQEATTVRWTRSMVVHREVHRGKRIIRHLTDTGRRSGK